MHRLLGALGEGAALQAVTFDGRQQVDIHLDELNQDFKTDAPFLVGAGAGGQSPLRGKIDDVRVYCRCLSADEVSLVATTDAIRTIVLLPPEKRSGRGRSHRGYPALHESRNRQRRF